MKMRNCETKDGKWIRSLRTPEKRYFMNFCSVIFVIFVPFLSFSTRVVAFNTFLALRRIAISQNTVTDKNETVVFAVCPVMTF